MNNKNRWLTVILCLTPLLLWAAGHNDANKNHQTKVLIYISTLENHRKAGVGKFPNQPFY